MLLKGFIRLLHKLFPLRYSPEQMSASTTELELKYRKHTLSTVALFFVLAPACIYACYMAVQSLVSIYQPAIAGLIYAIRTDSGIWQVTALFPGTTLACCIIALISRLWLGRGRSQEYRMLANRLAGLNATKAYILIGSIMTGGSVLMAYFAVTSGVFLGANEMLIRRMWSLQEEWYRYDQVRALQEVWDDKGWWDFVMQLNGAPDWITIEEHVYPDGVQKAWLAKRTGKPISKIRP